MRRTSVALFAIAFSLAAATAFACLWDYDTLAMERQRFPDALELIAGKFLRHSPDYYRWRVKDRTLRIADAPTSAALYDDLAVAYEKLGDHAMAIETILKAESFAPGRYETFANLGTFYIHSGKLKEGVEQIDKAIRINPEAHFGREIYQKLLVNYVLAKQQDGKTSLPLFFYSSEAERADLKAGKKEVNHDFHGPCGFAEFVLDQKGPGWNSSPYRDMELDKALKGILGMMRFGDYKSPVLLEALGDILMARAIDGKLLAARAYLRASYEAKDPKAKENYRWLARMAIENQREGPGSGKAVKFEELEKTFLAEIREADNWYLEVARNESRWLSEGLNLDAEFEKKYYFRPEVDDEAQSIRNAEAWNPNPGVLLLYGAMGLAWSLFAVKIRRDIRSGKFKKSGDAE